MDDGGEGLCAEFDGFSGRRCGCEAHLIGREVFWFAQADEDEARRGHALTGIEYGGLVAFAAEVAACNEVGNKPVQRTIGCRLLRRPAL